MTIRKCDDTRINNMQQTGGCKDKKHQMQTQSEGTEVRRKGVKKAAVSISVELRSSPRMEGGISARIFHGNSRRLWRVAKE